MSKKIENIDYKKLYLEQEAKHQSTINELIKRHEEEKAIITNKHNSDIEKLKDNIRSAIAKIFASSSEKLTKKLIERLKKIPNDILQGILEDEPFAILNSDEAVKTRKPSTKSKENLEEKQKKSVYNKKPDKTITYTPKDKEICVMCGSQMIYIGRELKRILNKVLENYHIIEEIYEKFMCTNPDCRHVEKGVSNISSFNNSFATTDLVADAIVNKIEYGLPITRQCKQILQSDIYISKQVMSGWFQISAELLKPISDLIFENVYQQDVVHIDESPIQILNTKAIKIGKAQNKKGYIWVMVSGAHSKRRSVCYLATPDRKEINYTNLIDKFKPNKIYVHSDAFGVYKNTDKVTICNCNIHNRRKYYNIINTSMSNSNMSIAYSIFERINTILNMDSKYKDLTPTERKKIRTKEVLPLLETLREDLAKYQKLNLDNETGKAINYTIKHWNKLTAFMKDGRLSMHNNIAENAFTSLALSRKNFLFCDTLEGAKSIAIFLTIIGTAKLYNLNLPQYLSHLLNILGSAYDINSVDIESLLPWNKKIINKFSILKQK